MSEREELKALLERVAPRKGVSRPYRTGYQRGVEAALSVARYRANICADAVRLVEAGELYPNTPTAFATENCARLEANEIVRIIALLSRTDTTAALDEGGETDG